MTSIDFLRSELQRIATQFPNVHIKYGFNHTIDTHIVELLPLIEYVENKDLDKAWIPISLRFMELFADEEIAFISSDSSLSLEKVIFEFNISSCSEENIITELFAPLTERPFEYSFPTQIPDGRFIDNSLTWFSNIIEIESPCDEPLEGSNYSYSAAA